MAPPLLTSMLTRRCGAGAGAGGDVLRVAAVAAPWTDLGEPLHLPPARRGRTPCNTPIYSYILLTVNANANANANGSGQSPRKVHST
uniref:Uncharacterized protein n=1 Tax=Oryza glumipatula TaxID=40148 RepID=A0A0D9ZU30_9ORYZ